MSSAVLVSHRPAPFTYILGATGTRYFWAHHNHPRPLPIDKPCALYLVSIIDNRILIYLVSIQILLIYYTNLLTYLLSK